MKVVSVNIGKKRLIHWNGKEEYTGIYKKPVDHPIVLGDHDVVGDDVVDRKYHGGVDMACYIYSADHYPFWKEKYPNLDWDFGMFGENITIEGLNEKDFQLGDTYKLGTATVQIAQPRKPCYKLGIRFGTQAILKQYINANYPGIYLRIIEKGEVRIGDTFEKIKSHHEGIGFLETYRLQYDQDGDQQRIQEIIDSEIATKDIRNGLLKKLNS